MQGLWYKCFVCCDLSDGNIEGSMRYNATQCTVMCYYVLLRKYPSFRYAVLCSPTFCCAMFCDDLLRHPFETRMASPMMLSMIRWSNSPTLDGIKGSRVRYSCLLLHFLSKWTSSNSNNFKYSSTMVRFALRVRSDMTNCTVLHCTVLYCSMAKKWPLVRILLSYPILSYLVST